MIYTYQHTSFEPASGPAIYLDTTLGLLTQRIEIEPAKAKTEYLDLPGADGSVDMTEALGLGVLYHDRTIVWTLALRPDQDWYTVMSAVSDALNGLRFARIKVDASTYYYTGRVTVESHASDNLLHQIVIAARVAPFRRRDSGTSRTITAATTSIPVGLGSRSGPVLITNTGTGANGFTVSYKDGSGATKTVSVAPGASVTVTVQAGVSTLTVQSGTSAGSVQLNWQEVHL